MGEVFDKGTTRIYDQIYRRDADLDGLYTYPQEVRDCHHNFIQRVIESSESKIDIVYRLDVRNVLQSKFKDMTTMLPLWGPCKGISLLLVHERAFRNQ